jgi:hypothetical protein
MVSDAANAGAMVVHTTEDTPVGDGDPSTVQRAAQFARGRPSSSGRARHALPLLWRLKGFRSEVAGRGRPSEGGPVTWLGIDIHVLLVLSDGARNLSRP